MDIRAGLQAVFGLMIIFSGLYIAQGRIKGPATATLLIGSSVVGILGLLLTTVGIPFPGNRKKTSRPKKRSPLSIKKQEPSLSQKIVPFIVFGVAALILFLIGVVALIVSS